MAVKKKKSKKVLKKASKKTSRKKALRSGKKKTNGKSRINLPRESVKSKIAPQSRYKEEYCELIYEWLVDGKLIKDFCTHVGVTIPAYRDWRFKHPDFDFAIKFAKASGRYKWDDDFIDKCNLAIETGMEITEFSEKLDIPLNVLCEWDELIPEFNPIKLMKKAGMPTAYKEYHGKTLIELMSKGKSVAAFCSKLNIGRTTFHQWLDSKPSFKQSYETAKQKQQEYYEQLAESHFTGSRFSRGAPDYMQKADPNFLRFMMERLVEDYRPVQKIETNQNIEQKTTNVTQDLSHLSAEEIKILNKLVKKIEGKTGEEDA